MKDQRSIHEFPWLPDVTGVDPSNLGCVMLQVEFSDGLLERGYSLGAISSEDLYTSSDSRRFWIKGDVTAGAHVTLLYGLLTKAYEQEDTIHKLLADWACPRQLPVTGYDAFPSPYPDEDYACIVARVYTEAPALAEARGLLSFLPHVDTFTSFKSHATVAYVKSSAAEAWLDYLNFSLVSRDLIVSFSKGGMPKLNLGHAR